MTRVQNLKEQPEDILELAKQADSLQDIKVLYESKGGKILTETLIKDVIGAMKRLAYGSEHPERDCAKLRVNLDLLNLLVSAKDTEKHIDELIAQALIE